MVGEAPELKRHPQHGYLYYDSPSAESLQDHYEKKYFQTNDIYSSQYSDEECEFFRLAAKRKVGLVTSFLRHELSDSYSCLELGVGEGWSLAALSGAGARAMGVDYSNHAISKWNPELAESLQVGPPEAHLAKLAESGATFDLVWLDNVLEHVPDPSGFLNQVRRVVKAGGLLLIEVPNDGSPLHRFLQGEKLIDRSFWHAYPEHLTYFTRESLESLVTSLGFRVVDLLGDFPIDLFLLNDRSNYVNDRSAGKAAHGARLRFERFIAQSGPEATNELYRALARASLGRNLLMLCQLESKDV